MVLQGKKIKEAGLWLFFSFKRFERKKEQGGDVLLHSENASAIH